MGCILFNYVVLCCIALYYTVWYSSVFCCVVLCCIVLYCVVLYCLIPYYIVLYCIVLFICIVLYCMLCYIILYCNVLYCIVLYCIILTELYLEQENKLKVALLDYLKRYHPDDTEKYTMVAHHFSMYREIAENLENSAVTQLKTLKDYVIGEETIIFFS